jgi:PTS system nitrogen regulatory IIA component
MPASFGATLRLLRIDSGLSLRNLAQRIGVSSAYLSRVENGLDPVPTPDRLVEIARSLRLPPTLLLDLAHRTGSFVARYLEDVPAAGALFLEIARRRLTPMQIARLKAFVEAEFGGQSADTGTITLTSMLAPERIIVSLSCSELDDVIDVAAPRLLPAGRLSARELSERIRHRERAASTALGGGLAVPHALLPGVPPHAALITLAQPLVAQTPDGAPLRLVLVCVLPKEGTTHLHALAAAARIALHGSAAELLEKHDKQDPEALLQALRQIEGVALR